jgi:hypothetical protein
MKEAWYKFGRLARFVGIPSRPPIFESPARPYFKYDERTGGALVLIDLVPYKYHHEAERPGSGAGANAVFGCLSRLGNVELIGVYSAASASVYYCHIARLRASSYPGK